MKTLNAEILTITLPDEKPPIVDATQIFEVGGTIFQVRLTLTNNMLPASVVQQEQDLPLAAVKPEGSEYLNAEEAAAYLRLNERQLRDFCRDQRITHARFDYRTYRFKRADLDEWFEAYKVKRKSVYD